MKSRNCSKSFSSAYEYPHDTASRTECSALSGSTLVCMRILISNFNSLSEDHQDFAPEDETHNASEIHSFVSGGHEFSDSYLGSS